MPGIILFHKSDCVYTMNSTGLGSMETEGFYDSFVSNSDYNKRVQKLFAIILFQY